MRDPAFAAAGILGRPFRTGPAAGGPRLKVGGQQGAGATTVSVDGTPLPFERSHGAGATAAPELGPGRHVTTADDGCSGETSRAQTTIAATDTP